MIHEVTRTKAKLITIQIDFSEKASTHTLLMWYRNFSTSHHS